MPASKPIQVTFKGGINPMAPSHLVADDEVQTATNVDFSLVAGALVPRRGCVLNTSVSTVALGTIYNNYNDPATIANGFMYIADANGNVYRRTLTGAVPGAATTIATGMRADDAFPPVFSSYKQYTLIGNAATAGNPVYKDDGTNTTEWIKQVPSKPTVTINTLSAISLAGVYTAGVGTLVGTTGGTATANTDSAGHANIVLTLSSATNLSVNGTHTIGNFGVHIANIAFSDPTLINKISWDYSIDDALFNNFWHVELDPAAGGVNVGAANADPLIGAQLTVSSGSSATSQDRLDILSQIAQYNFSPLSFVPNVSNDLSPWAVTVPQYNYVGTNAAIGTNLWSNIYAMRINVDSEILNGTTTYINTMTVGQPQIYGAQDYPLTDVQNGYYYWQTFATLDSNNNKIDESATSPPAGPYPMQNNQAVIVTTATATGTKHGINAIITYRQGGFMADSYAIHTSTYTGTITFTDTTNDIDALTASFVMPRNLRAPSQFPGFMTSISDAVNDRIFVSNGNVVIWSLPGQIGSFPLDSFQEVSRTGDDIQGIVAWNPGMVIVNRNSVYEFSGTDFEAGQFQLTRTGSRKGSLATKTIIRTPYGIPLLNADGLTMYVPGYNMDQDILWFMDKYADVFRGNQSSDPAYYKGQRVPALNQGAIQHSVATFRDHKLYLGLPTGPSTYPNTLFVLDFFMKQAWWYTYAFNITALLQDSRSNLFWAGSADGKVMNLEYSTTDQNSSGTVVPLVWTARTRAWSADTDTVLENLSVDSEGTNIQLKAYYDNSTNPVLGTAASPTRQWNTPPLNGTFVNNVAFDFLGTTTATSSIGTLCAVYGMDFELLAEPVKTQYWRSEYDEKNWPADKLWDVAYFDLTIVTTGNVVAVTFVDNTAVMTNTITGPTSGRVMTEAAFPPETYGRIAYTTYTMS